MKDYRIFRLDNSGHITSSVEFFCLDDEEALTFAAQQENKAGLELWHRAQRLQVLPAAGARSAAA